MGKLDGKVAVITGAASGMGRATALRFAKEGAAVVVADLNSQAGEATIAEIAAGGGRAVFQHTDVASDAAIKSLIEPSEVADVVAFLAGPAGRTFTGVPVTMDQGWSAR